VTLLGLALTTAMSLVADRLGGARSTAGTALRRWGYVLLPLDSASGPRTTSFTF
jgi:hypothetical protein